MDDEVEPWKSLIKEYIHMERHVYITLRQTNFGNTFTPPTSRQYVPILYFNLCMYIRSIENAWQTKESLVCQYRF